RPGRPCTKGQYTNGQYRRRALYFDNAATRMSRRKRRKSELPGLAAPVKPAAPVPPGATAVARSRGAWVAGSLITLACLVAGYFAPNLFNGLATAARKAPTIVEGGGVNGPTGMMWVPGGEFLMGSDHKLAQPNERPTHRVKVGGFWMDRHHVTNA